MKRISVLMLILMVCFATAAWAQAPQAAKHAILTVDPPGAPGVNPYQGTQALAINASGTITGFYSDSINVMHSFIRGADGSYILFDAPDAGTQSVAGFLGTPMGVLGGQGTYSVAINKTGTVAGLYADIANILHGFLRTPDGIFTEFDVPGAGTGLGQGTNAGNINPSGIIAGFWVDMNSVTHGFVRSARGKITTFDAPGAGTAPGQGTYVGWATCLNPAGTVTGWFVDANNVSHAFIRSTNGTITTFDAPGAGTASGQGTYSWSINSSGAVTAVVVDSFGLQHGYLRYANGSFRVFEVPGAGKNPGQGTIPQGIDSKGIIVGSFLDPDGLNNGFWRAWNGQITHFRAPDAGTAPGQGTVPLTSNGLGQVTGAYFDSNFLIHGFLLNW